MNAVISDREATKEYVDSLKNLIEALRTKQDAHGEWIQALSDQLSANGRAFGAMDEVARVAGQIVEGLGSTKERLDAIEAANENLAQRLKNTSGQATGDAAHLLEEIAKLRQSVDILSMLTTDR